MTETSDPRSNPTLDPEDWQSLRQQGHQMLDDMLDYLEGIRDRPVWQPAPASVKAHFRDGLPRKPRNLADVHDDFMTRILPFSVGNCHPGFMGWVHGGGSPVGMLAEMLAGGLNANLGGRNQIPVDVERQIAAWAGDLFGFPKAANGLFVTGTSMANFIALLVARNWALGQSVRQAGVAGAGDRLVAYTSSSAHGCIAQAMDMAGLGTSRLRRIPVDADYRMDLDALRRAIAADRAKGLHPFMVVATVGSVDVGAIDDLPGISELTRSENLWLHIDGAFGALGMLAPDIAPRLDGIEQADSLAFDFHKWGQVPYDAGFILIRDGERLQSAFSSPAAYLQRDERGLAAGSPWPCDLGPDLSRGFRALKTWFTLQVYGADRLGQVISRTCTLARELAARIESLPELELMAPTPLNIVCFRYRCDEPDRVNAAIAADLHESGIAAPSTTRLANGLALRAAIVNHRTQQTEIHALVDAVLAFGRSRTGLNPQ